jgi:hypothetical protein
VQQCIFKLLLLIERVIVPKMFEQKKVPQELKGSRLKQKLKDYLIANPNNQYEINIKNISGKTNCIELLQKYLNKLTEEMKLKKDTFKINVSS